jgi:predicted CoA-substrate-specific enzyme activase
VLGIDLGSRQVKIVEMEHTPGSDYTISRTAIFDTITFYREHGIKKEEQLQVDFSRLGFSSGQPIVATGYGKVTLPVKGALQVSEIEAHVRGAIYQSGLQNFTLLDIGGQDTKVVKVQTGKMMDFRTNDRCAASSGRYVENMAAILGVDLEEMGLFYEQPVGLSSTCAIFGETEIIGKIVEGYSTSQLIAGVNTSLYQRFAAMLEQLESDVIVLSGGGARNPALAKIISRERKCEVYTLPQLEFNGAIGCCIIGMENF